MIDPTPSTESWAGIAALALFVLRELWNIYREKNKPRIDNATARGVEQQAELSAAQADKIKSDIQRDVLDQVHIENNNLRDRLVALESDLSRERLARIALEQELSTERKSRLDLESRLNAAQQRISALEDELDKRNARIKELESRSTGEAGGLMGNKR